MGALTTQIGAAVDRFRAWRTIHGVSRDELARRLGMDSSTVSRWEVAETEPHPSVRDELERLLASLSSPDDR